jgi:hypothetical protein
MVNEVVNFVILKGGGGGGGGGGMCEVTAWLGLWRTTLLTKKPGVPMFV